MVDEYIAPADLEMVHQIEANIQSAAQQSELADLTLQKAHAEKRAAEAELRAVQAEYHGTIMKLLWKYKLDGGDSFRPSDGLIIKKGEKNGEEGNDTSSESEESQGDG